MTPGAANEAVWAAKNKLDDVLDQFETLDEFLGSERQYSGVHKGIFAFSDEREFTRIRDHGVGRVALEKLLGHKWRATIETALSALAEDAARAHAARLDDVLDQFETLDEFLGSHVENFPRGQQIFEFSRPEEYSKIRDYGVGLRPLMRFLGDNWEGTIKAALSALAEDAARAHAERLARATVSQPGLLRSSIIPRRA